MSGSESRPRKIELMCAHSKNTNDYLEYYKALFYFVRTDQALLLLHITTKPVLIVLTKPSLWQ